MADKKDPPPPKRRKKTQDDGRLVNKAVGPSFKQVVLAAIRGDEDSLLLITEMGLNVQQATLMAFSDETSDKSDPDLLERDGKDSGNQNSENVVDRSNTDGSEHRRNRKIPSGSRSDATPPVTGEHSPASRSCVDPVALHRASVALCAKIGLSLRRVARHSNLSAETRTDCASQLRAFEKTLQRYHTIMMWNMSVDASITHFSQPDGCDETVEILRGLKKRDKCPPRIDNILHAVGLLSNEIFLEILKDELKEVAGWHKIYQSASEFSSSFDARSIWGAAAGNSESS